MLRQRVFDCAVAGLRDRPSQKAAPLAAERRPRRGSLFGHGGALPFISIGPTEALT